MTVYIDQYPDWLGVPRKWVGGGHLFASDLAELHAFARRLGLRREWFQGTGFPHYDLTANKRRQAIERGATVLEPGVIPGDVVRRVPPPDPAPLALFDKP